MFKMFKALFLGQKCTLKQHFSSKFDYSVLLHRRIQRSNQAMCHDFRTYVFDYFFVVVDLTKSNLMEEVI